MQGLDLTNLCRNFGTTRAVDDVSLSVPYARWPHMSVAVNIRFGPRLLGLPRALEQARIDETLALVGLAGTGHRRPHALSGGQRQRVARAQARAAAAGRRPALAKLTPTHRALRNCASSSRKIRPASCSDRRVR